MKVGGKPHPQQIYYGKSPEHFVGPRAGLQHSLPGVEDGKIIVNFKLRIGTFSPQKNGINRPWMPRVLRSESAAIRLPGLRVRWHGLWIVSVVNVVCCVSRGLCDWPIPRTGESRRLCVCVCVSLSVIRSNTHSPYLR